VVLKETHEQISRFNLCIILRLHGWVHNSSLLLDVADLHSGKANCGGEQMKTTAEMAREAQIIPYIVGPTNSEYIGRLERFAEIVRADEREACLEIADDCAESDMHASMAANFIRARSNI
jgi:hypothetical protein